MDIDINIDIDCGITMYLSSSGMRPNLLGRGSGQTASKVD